MNKKISLNMNQLKLIAVFFMLIDHVAYVMLERGTGLYGSFYTIDRIMRGMGRIAFPIFCFTIVEGFQRTSDARGYLKRLIMFALISEIPFDLAFRGTLFTMEYQNVFWTLAFGLAALMITEDPLMTPLTRTLGLLACFWLPIIFHTDYSFYGVAAIYLMYFFRKEPLKMCMAGYIALLLQSRFEIWAVFGFLLILLYNGQKGHGSKLFYYVFYPGHLLVLALLQPFVTAILSGLMVSVTVI